MKTMTCAEMGGLCEQKITSGTSGEMMTNIMTHIMAAHPEMVADIKAMPNDDPKMIAWYEKLMKIWEATPDTEQEM